MKAICHQFEEEEEGTDKQEKILQLMQEVITLTKFIISNLNTHVL